MDALFYTSITGATMTYAEALQVLVNLVKRNAPDEALIEAVEDSSEVEDAAWTIWYDYSDSDARRTPKALRAALKQYIAEQAAA